MLLKKTEKTKIIVFIYFATHPLSYCSSLAKGDLHTNTRQPEHA